jgi:hypothetical protein
MARRAGELVTVTKDYYLDLHRRAKAAAGRVREGVVTAVRNPRRTAVAVYRDDKGGLVSAAAGAAVMFVATMDSVKDMKLFKEHWWLLPVLVLLVGWWLRKKGNRYGTAIMAAGAALFVKAWREQPADDKDKKKQSDGETKGVDDDAYYTRDGRWVRNPQTGATVWIPTSAAYQFSTGPADYASQIADKVYPAAA